MSDPFEAILRRMLHRDPRQRFGSAAEALNAVLALPSYDPSHAPLSRLVRSIVSNTASQPQQSQQAPVPAPPLAATKILEPKEQSASFPRTVPLPASSPPPIAQLAEEHSTSKGSPRAADPQIPRRQTEFGFVAGFSRHRVAQNLSGAIERFEREAEIEAGPRSFEAWILAKGSGGVEPVHGCRLPEGANNVLPWARFIDLGWRRTLTWAWYGKQPWGPDGFWVAEDALADEAMVLAASDLKRPTFAAVTQAQWIAWWAEREVDIALEFPGGRAPVSSKARALLAPGEDPPLSRADWLKLWGDRDPESAGTDIIRKLKQPASHKVTLRRSLWQRVFNVAPK